MPMTDNSSLESETKSRLLIRPAMGNKKEVVDMVWKIFGLQVSKEDQPKVNELISYDDRNFHLKGKLLKSTNKDHTFPTEYLLKVMHSCETYNPDALKAIDLAMIHIDSQNAGFHCSKPIPSLSGEMESLEYIKVSGDLPERQNIIATYLRSQENARDPFLKLESQPGSGEAFSPDSWTLFMKHYFRLLTYLPGKPFPDGALTNDLLYKVGKFTAKVRIALKVILGIDLICCQI